MAVQWSVPAWLWPLLLVGAAGAVVWTVRAYQHTRPLPDRRLRRTLILLRSSAFILLMVGVAGPVLSLIQNHSVPAQLVVVLEDSGSMSIQDARPIVDGTTEPAPELLASRWQSAAAVASRLEKMMQDWEPSVEVVCLRGNGLDPLRELSVVDAPDIVPEGHGTDLDALLAQVGGRVRGHPVRAVVLLSDGQETVGNAGTGTGQQRITGKPRSTNPGRAGDLPLVVVGLGDPAGPPDRLLKDLRHPHTAFVGDEVVVELSVAHRFVGDTPLAPVRVRLTGSRGVLVDTTTTASTLSSLELSFRPDSTGVNVYRLDVDPMDNERFLENNTASIAIDVRKDRAKLLVLAAVPGWDVRFLAQAAAMEQRLELAVVYNNADGPVYADSLARWEVPATGQDWDRWDGVVLVGWTGPISRLDWPALSEAVNAGLGLLVIPGGGSTGAAGGNALAPDPELARILPVTAAAWRWQVGPFFATVAEEQDGHAVLAGVGGAESGTGPGVGLGGLPPVRLMLGGRVRENAQTLLTGRGRDAADDRPELPLLVLDRRGEGRVAWFGGRRLWELAFWEDASALETDGPVDQGARRLLRNLLVWLGSGEEEAGLQFSGHRAFFQEGEKIRLAAQWRDMRGLPVADRDLSMVLRRAATPGAAALEQTYELQMSDHRRGIAEVELPPLPPGTYTIQLLGEGDPPVLGNEETLVVSGHSIEMTQVRQDRRRLGQLAARLSGQHLSGEAPDLVGDLAAALEALDWSGQVQEMRSRFEPGSGWPFLAVVAVLLGCEWFLRRRNGLL